MFTPSHPPSSSGFDPRSVHVISEVKINGTGKGFFPEYFGFPLAVSSHQSSTPIHLLSTVYILKFLAESPNHSLLPPHILLKMSRKRKRNLAVELKAVRICSTDAGDRPAFLPARCTHEESDEGHSRSRWCVPQRACKWYRSRQFISLLGIATL